MNIGGLSTTGNMNIGGTVQADIIGTHQYREAGSADGLINISSGKNTVVYQNPGTIQKLNEAVIGSTVIFFTGYIVCNIAYFYIGTGDADVPAVISISGFCLIGDGKKFSAGQCESFPINGIGMNCCDFFKIKGQG